MMKNFIWKISVESLSTDIFHIKFFINFLKPLVYFSESIYMLVETVTVIKEQSDTQFSCSKFKLSVEAAHLKQILSSFSSIQM